MATEIHTRADSNGVRIKMISATKPGFYVVLSGREAISVGWHILKCGLSLPVIRFLDKVIRWSGG